MMKGGMLGNGFKETNPRVFLAAHPTTNVYIRMSTLMGRWEAKMSVSKSAVIIGGIFGEGLDNLHYRVLIGRPLPQGGNVFF